jgi:hypothetical protein
MCDKITECAVLQGNSSPSAPIVKTKIYPSKKWVFTYNNYSDENVRVICAIIKECCKKGFFSKEICPTTGTPHLQGYIEFKVKHRPFERFKIYNKAGVLCMHWAKAKGTKGQNSLYITKYGSQTMYFEHPVKFIQLIENLKNWQIEIINLIGMEPDDRSIYWYWEPVGCKGKTTFQKYCVTHFDRILVLDGNEKDMLNGVITYYNDRIELPRVIMINIARYKMNRLSITGIEKVKDMLFYSGKYEGGMVCGKCPHIIIFANSPPPEWWYKEVEGRVFRGLSKDRWHIIRVEEDSCRVDPMNSVSETIAENDENVTANLGFQLNFD